MKPSSYNLIIERYPYSYWYNTLNKSFFRISSTLGQKLRKCFDEYKHNSIELPDYLLDKLLSGGFLIDDNVNELDIVRKFNKRKIENKDYFMIVLPTLNCNYHCWYCIQDHIESKMSDDVINKIKKHIDYMVNIEKIESLHIDWFGGEPFIYFDEIIKPISTYAKTVCKKADIPFYNSSTTNGYFLNKQTIEALSELLFKHFQITLDGNKEFHDKVKFQQGCSSTIEHVLGNINRMLSTVSEVYVSLRINYTHKNLNKDIVQQVNGHINRNNRSRVHISPHKVWQENIDRDFHSELSLILDKFKQAGYSVERWDPVNNFIPCYANKKYYNAINYNGNIVKCTACDDLYKEKSLGRLHDDGSIIWSDCIANKYSEPTFENESCLKCIKLPICMGLCPREHVNGKVYCKEDVFDTPFNESIIDLINRSYDENI